MTTIEKFVLFIIIVILGSVFVVPFVRIHISTGKGSQVGYVSAVEKGGLIWKTGTAYIKPTLESTQEDIYCVIDERVYEELEQKSISGEKVKVSHNSYLSAGITNCNGEDAIINKVELVN